jgi:hypothetical protein
VRWLSPSREKANFNSTKEEKEGYQQKTCEHAAMRQHQGDNLGKHQREGTVLRNDLLSAL